MTEKVTKKISVKDFLNWLEGVEEFMLVDANEPWTPSATQWKRIRDKIKEIDDSPSPVPASRVVTPSQPDDGRPVNMGTPVYAPSGMMPNPAADLAGRPFLPETPGQAARTPSIDTSNGTYNTPFA